MKVEDVAGVEDFLTREFTQSCFEQGFDLKATVQDAMCIIVISKGE